MGLFDGIRPSPEAVAEAAADPLAEAERGAGRLAIGSRPGEVAARLRERPVVEGTVTVAATRPAGSPAAPARVADGPGAHGGGSTAGSAEVQEGVPPAPASALQRTPPGVDLLRTARMPPTFDEGLQAAFLEHLCQVPNIELAAFRVGVMASQVASLRDKDPGFNEAVLMARKVASGMVEDQAFRLAVHGARKGVYFQGMRIDEEVQYLPDLMRTVMSANDDRYKSKVELSGKVDVKHSWADMIRSMDQEDNKS